MNQQSNQGVLERWFHLSENHTTVKRECLAGLTVFVSMAYILFVNPSILGAAGMDKGAVFTATAISAIAGCLLMGILANYPIGIAPGLGDNAFFSYSVVLAMGIPWQDAMAGVFVASVLFTLVSVFKLREIIIDAIPQDLKYAMAAGIGIFISFVGLSGGGLVVSDPDALVAIGSFSVPTTWLTIFGVFVTAVMMAKKIPGSLFYGIVLTAAAGLITGIIAPPDRIISMAPSLTPTLGVSIKYIPAILGDFRMWAVVVVFFLVAFFDTAGTLIGLAQQAGFIHEGKMPRIGKALMADSFSMLGGAILGTTPTSAYVESSAGIAMGARTGLTAVVVAILFAFSMVFSPLLAVVTAQVTAPALIIVGVLMASSLREIHWEQFEVAFPCFMIIVGMPLTFNISYGIAFGFLFYPLLMLAVGRKKELNWLVWLLFILFLLLLYTLTLLKA
ncbi:MULTISPECIES: NCS2 family permease [Megasphaera]|jgi:hypothetical protein|uniref:Guanine/hypoxanthine permease PbuG n=1 Tax=Megasphaera hutchinsoni TaxID=1588748 RepID=A0A134CD65_9FIRM|nr:MULTISPECIES: NCS2 family permease [Megasphaera]EGS31960.1 guanine/hypoxanthine permease PbuG [Megasphaera sp. UPII 135-E]KXB90158.1 guanine/hypoxanthine permease PbuG [Megasphaera hutchinsoni]PNH22141.1 NCS2 family permease [Megasphaera genomosp. type_2]